MNGRPRIAADEVHGVSLNSLKEIVTQQRNSCQLSVAMRARASDNCETRILKRSCTMGASNVPFWLEI